MSDKIFVIGSYSGCYTFRAKALPGPGETVQGDSFKPVGAGKGSNQALAAHYLGGEVHVLMRIGKDEYGELVKSKYEERGMDVSNLIIDEETYTGRIGIFYGGAGENCMIAVPGANGKLSRADVDRALPLMKECAVCGVQFEANPDAALYALHKASELGVKTLLDPAPAIPLDREVYKDVSIIKPNEHEASQLVGFPVETPDSAMLAGKVFLDWGVKEAAIITLGSKGCVLVSHETVKYYPAPRVIAVDSGGAGDSFAGTLLYYVAKGVSLNEAVTRATCNASLVASKKGSMIDVFPAKEKRDEMYALYTNSAF